MGTAGKVLAIIGAIVGVASVLLGFVLPAFFSWFRMEISYGGTVVLGVYVSGFGTVSSVPAYYTAFAYLELVGGIVLIVGAILCIVSAGKGSKAPGIVGGILMLVAPLILIVDLLLVSGADFAALIALMGGPADPSILWGSFSPAPGVLLSWGIWIGAFVALGAGVLGLIGGATV